MPVGLLGNRQWQIMSDCVEQGHQPTTAVQSDQVIATTHMGTANENLGNGSESAGSVDQGLPLFIIAGDVNLLESHTFAPKELFGLDAEGAVVGGVDDDRFH